MIDSGGIPSDLRDHAGVVLDPEDIVFTDPDAEDPDSIVPELKELLSAAPTEVTHDKVMAMIISIVARCLDVGNRFGRGCIGIQALHGQCIRSKTIWL